jgi:hypothetical protein
MCEPATAAAAAVVIGTKMKWDAAEKAKEKANTLTNSEIDRQKALERLARAKQGTALSKYGKGNVESEMRGETDRLSGLFSDSAGTIARNPNAGTSNSVIQGIEDQTISDANTAVADRGQRMANVNAFGNALAALAPSLQEARNAGRRSSNFMRGSANVLNRELDEASRGAYSPLGDFLSNMGMVGVNYGLKKDPKVVS